MSDDLITLADVREIRNAAERLVILSAKSYTPSEKVGDQSYPQGLEEDRIRARAIERVADKIESRAGV